jgi:adenine-specific DNA methylase
MGLTAESVLLDPFCGVGTLNIEASLCGIRSIGIDVNPLFTFVGDAKVKALRLRADDLKHNVEILTENVRSILADKKSMQDGATGIVSLTKPNMLPATLSRGVKKESLLAIQKILALIEESISDADIRSFCKIPLAFYMKSMLRKYTIDKIVSSYSKHLWRMFFSVQFMDSIIHGVKILPLGDADFYTMDNQNMHQQVSDVDAIITSPPYTTAIDYVGNDAHTLYVLGLSEDHKALDRQTIGNTCYYKEMESRFAAMRDVLRTGGRLVLIIGKEQEIKVDGKNYRLEVAKSLVEEGQKVGLRYNRTTEILLAKSSYGAIFSESIMHFSKV